MVHTTPEEGDKEDQPLRFGGSSCSDYQCNKCFPMSDEQPVMRRNGETNRAMRIVRQGRSLEWPGVSSPAISARSSSTRRAAYCSGMR